jgi:hypothetical protein
MTAQHYFLTATSHFLSTVPPEIASEILTQTLDRIKPEGEGQDFIVFSPEARDERIEDEGRTLILPTKAPRKCYAKLDDFGSVEALRDFSGLPALNTQYLVTVMLAEDY